MAKRKKPVSIFNLPKEEVAKASSEIIRKTSKEKPPAAPPPPKPVTKPKVKATTRKPVAKKKTPAPPKTPPPTPKGTGKRKFLYVDEATHLQAKINAAKRGMKLQQYIAWLITNDQSA